MSNVLPIEAREKIMRSTLARLVMTGTLVCSLSAIVAILALTPAFLMFAIPLMQTDGVLSAAGAEQAALHKENRATVTRVRALLAALSSFAEKKPPPHALIEKMYARKPAGVDIDTIKFLAGPPGQIIITGSSGAREPVNDFRTALKEEEVFAEVSVPVAALVGALDGQFTMTLKGAF